MRVNGGKRKLAFRTRYNVVATRKRGWFGKTTHFARLCQNIKRLLYERGNVLAPSDLDSTSKRPQWKGKVRGKSVSYRVQCDTIAKVSQDRWKWKSFKMSVRATLTEKVKGNLLGSLWVIDLGKPSLYRPLDKCVATPTLRKSVAIPTLCPKASLDGFLQTSLLYVLRRYGK